MTRPGPYTNIDQIQEDTFDGNLYIEFDQIRRLDIVHELCTNAKYSKICQKVKTLEIFGVKGIDFGEPNYFLAIWTTITKYLPCISSIHIKYDAKRYKFRVKEPEFELVTEEWFRVRKDEYKESFNRGEEDLEYEYPADLLHLHDLKTLLLQRDNKASEVFLTTRVFWSSIRRQDATQELDEGMQSIRFRVLADDMEGILRKY